MGECQVPGNKFFQMQMYFIYRGSASCYIGGWIAALPIFRKNL